jgi:hypothetical protein
VKKSGEAAGMMGREETITRVVMGTDNAKAGDGRGDYFSRGSLRTLAIPEWLNDFQFVNSSSPRD